MQVVSASFHPATGKWLVASVVILGTFVSVMDISIVNVAMPQMLGTFGGPWTLSPEWRWPIALPRFYSVVNLRVLTNVPILSGTSTEPFPKVILETVRELIGCTARLRLEPRAAQHDSG